MEHSLVIVCRILVLIGGAGMLIGSVCELINIRRAKKYPEIVAQEKAAYRNALIKSYEEAYRDPVPSFYLRLPNVQYPNPYREIPVSEHCPAPMRTGAQNEIYRTH